MISDDKRREVAATMWAVSVRGVRDLTLGEVLNSILTGGKPRPTTDMEILARLADLIDRPTCHDVGGGYEFRCSGCGCVIHIFRDAGYGEDDSAMSVGGEPLYVPKFCPNCGAEVVDRTIGEER